MPPLRYGSRARVRGDLVNLLASRSGKDPAAAGDREAALLQYPDRAGVVRDRVGVQRTGALQTEQGSEGRGSNPASPVGAIDRVGDLPLIRRAEDRRVAGHPAVG